ncbi:hypothetical protein HGRIS_014529 [Hohenbuehelia grisea]|uniref:P-loop containing nucleoside triphosphate hydrolase protein n=1 Tax=Hohenbuehelia grisea TaxID=104357 RepID=A0ABR3JVH9_9AGAR
MHFIPMGPESWSNLPRAGGVAYAAQESWVQNDTIRANITFGEPFDEERYNKVVYQCCLERDLELFGAGDKTEVGEKGLTLSGGQKARITLARAIYSRADILLLDDVFAALDVHTAKWILDKCFSGDLIRGRTVILVTHNVAMASSIAEFVVSVNVDGTVVPSGSLLEAISKDKALAEEVKQDKELLEKAEDRIDTTPEELVHNLPDGKLIVEEEIQEGHVGWPAFGMLLAALGGSHSLLFFTTYTGGRALSHVVYAGHTWFLGHWAAQYEDRDASEVSVAYYLSRFAMLVGLCICLVASSDLIFYSGIVRRSRRIHHLLIDSVLGTTLRWLDITPTSRIIARCTRDIGAVDGPLSQELMWLIDLTVSTIIAFSIVILFTPRFFFPGFVIAILGGCCAQVDMSAQLSVKREMSNAKAPVLGHFGAAIAGIVSIRAYGAEADFVQESMARIDKYTRTSRTFQNLSRWLNIRIEALGGLFTSSLAAHLFYFSGHNASDTGFSLDVAVAFNGMLLFWVRIFNSFEIQANSLERIQSYVQIEQEPKPTPEGRPPAHWPSSGDLVVENLSARYSLDGPQVLHGISFHVQSGERIGVVGRTGSGKSSLTLSLLRCIYTEGTMLFDGIPTASVNLDALRASITIIPQVPELLSGTLRQNLDPFGQHEDVVLNDALRAAGLYTLQGADDAGRVGLDTQVSSGGGNLSVGQRQIIALARAMVRQSKLLILDEATSVIDYKTDAVIQASLRTKLASDVTLLVVAHRLQTIMDADKIMVLDAGRIVEYGRPKELLGDANGKLRALVDESGDRDALVAMAQAAQRDEIATAQP